MSDRKSAHQCAIDLAHAQGALKGLQTALDIASRTLSKDSDAMNGIHFALVGAQGEYDRASAALEAACIDDALAEDSALQQRGRSTT